MSKPLVWMLGDWEQPEFAPAVAYLRREVNLDLLPSDIRGSGVFGVCDFAKQTVWDAKDGGPRTTDPDLILLVASRPGRFSAAEVESLHRRAPLARLVALLGSWCEGEVRSGHPWPGVTRIYAHQWQVRLPRELETWQPRTATEIDRLMSIRPATKSQRQLIGIAAAQRTMFDALAAACRSYSKDAVWLLPNLPPPVQRVDAVIYDATLDLPDELARLTELRDQLHNPPALLLLNCPRQNDLEQAAQAGASSILVKPYLITDLAAEIERITTPAAHRLIAAA
ncbi:MAG: response regulator [Planctomycetales bacterium]|nr:response regulator [Planctomycetales bacterium]